MGNKLKEPIDVKFSFSQRDLILGKHQGGFPIAPLIDDNFRTALVQGKAVVVKMTLDEVEELVGFVAAEANHANNRSLEKKYDSLYVYLENILDKENRSIRSYF